MKKIVLLALAIIVAAAAADAQCVLDLTSKSSNNGKRHELKWPRVPGATSYVVEEVPVVATTPARRFEIAQDAATETFSLHVERLTTHDVHFRYRITAFGVASCFDERVVMFRADASFRKEMLRSAIPIVGSAPGVNGAVFKTSLRLRSQTSEAKGRLVFHPVGVPATANDPVIPYDLANGPMEWDDIVAAFGATGLGSIDIIPEPTLTGEITMPDVDVRMFNVAPEGTYGTLGVQTQPFAFHASIPGTDPRLNVTVPGSQLRLNMGVRTFIPSEVMVTVMRNEQTIATRTFDVPADTLLFNTAAAFIGAELLPGDSVWVQVTKGAGVPIYTLTDNQTNDPALFVPPARVVTNIRPVVLTVQ